MQVSQTGMVTLGIFLYGILPNSAQAQTYIGVYGGDSFTFDSDLAVNQSARGNNAVFDAVRWSSRAFENPVYWGLKVGYDFPKSPWAVELDYTHTKVYARVNDNRRVSGIWNGQPIDATERLGNRVERFSISDGVNIIASHLIYRFKGDRWQPYVGGGPAYFIFHPENRINGISNNEKFESGNWGYELLGGVRYRFARRYRGFAELKFSEGMADVDIAGGTARTGLRTLHGVLGVQAVF